jgi:phosphoglycolate phosphatase-like HAD superfamily hydrolase
MIGHVVFDFDGTLVRSNRIKRDCFHETLADVPGGAAILDDLFASHYRGDRFALFREVVRRLGPDCVLEPDELAARYGRLCRIRIGTAPEVPGAGTALSRLAEAGVRMFLISATPQQALDEVVADRGLAGLFDLVLGAPTGKSAHLCRVIETCGITAADIVMVGDGHDDLAAAADVGCRFIAVTDQPTVPFGDVETSIPDLRGLPEVLGLTSPAEGLPR